MKSVIDSLKSDCQFAGGDGPSMSLQFSSLEDAVTAMGNKFDCFPDETRSLLSTIYEAQSDLKYEVFELKSHMRCFDVIFKELIAYAIQQVTGMGPGESHISNTVQVDSVSGKAVVDNEHLDRDDAKVDESGEDDAKGGDDNAASEQS